MINVRDRGHGHARDGHGHGHDDAHDRGPDRDDGGHVRQIEN